MSRYEIESFSGQMIRWIWLLAVYSYSTLKFNFKLSVIPRWVKELESKTLRRSFWIIARTAVLKRICWNWSYFIYKWMENMKPKKMDKSCSPNTNACFYFVMENQSRSNFTFSTFFFNLFFLFLKSQRDIYHLIILDIDINLKFTPTNHKTHKRNRVIPSTTSFWSLKIIDFRKASHNINKKVYK